MELTQKGEMVSRLQGKAEQIGKILTNLEKYNHFLGPDHDLVKALRSPTTNENIGEKLDKLKAESSAQKGPKSKDEGPPNKKLNLQEIPPFRKSNSNNKTVAKVGEWNLKKLLTYRVLRLPYRKLFQSYVNCSITVQVVFPFTETSIYHVTNINYSVL